MRPTSTGYFLHIAIFFPKSIDISGRCRHATRLCISIQFGVFSVSNNAGIINNLIITEAFAASIIGIFIITQPVARRDASGL